MTKKEQKHKTKSKGITLIALVITIIVLLILAGVSIAMLTGDNGILTQARRAKEATETAAAEEAAQLEQLENEMTGESYLKSKGVNAPDLLSGMTKVSFTLPNGTTKGEVVKAGDSNFDENNWYDYKTGKWANAVTEDGSYWVWIPRFAYKIEGQTIHVKFLINDTDQYYDDSGNLQTAKRATSKDETVDTTTDFYVHPAFTNESSIDYANGGWDKELTGIWVAKFEAGFASGNNDAEVKASNVNYNQTTAWVPTVETTKEDTNGDGGETDTARNWLDGIYGTTTTAIKYPTFQPVTYSMNYININDAYNISRALTDSGNIYGLNSGTTDSHLMKNSEWGAVAYLGWSQYGTNGVEPYINNINANSGNRKRTETAGKTELDSVYAITGLTTAIRSGSAKTTTEADINEINSRSGNEKSSSGIYAWDQTEGQKASSTLNMYGVYDLSGGVWERTAGYINNGNSNLGTYGAIVITGGDTSTKYATVYPHVSSEGSDIDTASKNNYQVNTKIFGDAIRETSTSGTLSSSWNGDYSYFPALVSPFALRGGYYWGSSIAGLFAFYRTHGNSYYYNGFRPVLVAT